jgi:hypothetical protein
MKKRLLVLSDMHCGHLVGLTHPGDNPRYDDERKDGTAYRDYLYNWFEKEVKALGKIDVLVHNGDAIDGKGVKSGGTEQICMDRNEQAAMAANVLSRIRTKDVRLTYGTGYHTGNLEDYEDVVSNILGCPRPSATLDLELNGVVFNFKHKVGGSQIPHGRLTAQLRDKLWNNLWSMRGEYPKSDIQIRSHNHYFIYGGDSEFLVMGTPALQGYGSKYGTRIMSGMIDYGFVHFDITDKGDVTWEPHLLRMPYQAPETL